MTTKEITTSVINALFVDPSPQFKKYRLLLESIVDITLTILEQGGQLMICPCGAERVCRSCDVEATTCGDCGETYECARCREPVEH